MRTWVLGLLCILFGYIESTGNRRRSVARDVVQIVCVSHRPAPRRVDASVAPVRGFDEGWRDEVVTEYAKLFAPESHAAWERAVKRLVCLADVFLRCSWRGW